MSDPGPSREVIRTGASPMNPRVKWAELSCGHDIYVKRRPPIGARVPCDRCAALRARSGGGAP